MPSSTPPTSQVSLGKHSNSSVEDHTNSSVAGMHIHYQAYLNPLISVVNRRKKSRLLCPRLEADSIDNQGLVFEFSFLTM